MLNDEALQARRKLLLRALNLWDLRSVRERVVGHNCTGTSTEDLRAAILKNWEPHLDGLRQWCEFTLQGGN
jgi:hypothetical protein